MNREIKFRTWDKQLKQFAEWTNRDPFFDTSHGQIFFWERVQREDGSYDGDIILQDHGDRFVLQQYTGLKDKNEKEIYEGDIIQYDRCDSAYDLILKSVVYFYNGQFGFDLKGFNDMFFALGDEFCPEIIGNIFENPDYFKNK